MHVHEKLFDCPMGKVSTSSEYENQFLIICHDKHLACGSLTVLKSSVAVHSVAESSLLLLKEKVICGRQLMNEILHINFSSQDCQRFVTL